MQTTKQIAETIMSQLGANRFIAMTGAKNMLHGAHQGFAFLSFRIPTAKKINFVRISLQDDDTYLVEFKRVAGASKLWEVTDVCEVSGVYADRLRGVFTEHTGLHTSI